MNAADPGSNPVLISGWIVKRCGTVIRVLDLNAVDVASNPVLTAGWISGLKFVFSDPRVKSFMLCEQPKGLVSQLRY